MIGQRFRENPFYVLGLRPDCSRADLEREGQKLLAMLELQIEAARTYATPLGPMPRTADAVRQAMAELRDPQRRLLHELWAQLPATAEAPAPAVGTPHVTPAPQSTIPADAPAAPAAPAGSAAANAETGPLPSWPQARSALGFGARR